MGEGTTGGQGEDERGDRKGEVKEGSEWGVGAGAAPTFAPGIRATTTHHAGIDPELATHGTGISKHTAVRA